MIFTQSLQRIDASNPTEAIKKMANHIKYIQEQLEYTLLNLDSRNINEIDLDSTTITGSKKENFTVGINDQGQFVFSVGDGTQKLYLNSSGEIVITKHSLTIDGGKW